MTMIADFHPSEKQLAAAAVHRQLRESDRAEADAWRLADRDGLILDKLQGMVQSAYRLAAAFGLRFPQRPWVELAYHRAAQTCVDKMQEILGVEAWQRQSGVPLPAEDMRLRYELAARAIVNSFLFTLDGTRPLNDDETLALERELRRG